MILRISKARMSYLLSSFLFLASATVAVSRENARITGKVTSAETGEPLEKINVSVKGTARGTATDGQGRYVISSVLPGSYVLVFSGIGYEDKELSVIVTSEAGTAQDVTMVEEVLTLGNVTVYGASKHPQRITQAPVAISTISETTVRQVASTGQIPRLFDNQPGVDITQNGMNDYNLNTRGFNSSLNGRVLVLIDNRETSIVLLNVQEWNGYSFPLEDLGRLELVRGPGSALYGANAYSGVINIATPAPKDILGTKVKVSGGELSSFRLDARHAGASGPWSYKLNLGHTRSETWSKSRNLSQEQLDAQEYRGLQPEILPLADDDLSTSYGSARLDYDVPDGGVFTAEGGFAQAQDQVFITGIGRVQVDKANRPWARATFASDRFFLQADYSGRKTFDGQQNGLNSGVKFKEDSYNVNFQFQHNLTTLQDRIRFIWGASQKLQRLDTDRTLTLDDYNENQTGLFAQLEYQLTDRLEVVGAARVDRSSLHDTQLSPKAAVVFSPNPDHSFRATINRAFQTPNYAEFFLQAPAGVPVDLAPLETGIEAAIAQQQGLPPGSVDLPLDFGLTPVLALGNDDLEVETITGYEVGYKGIVSNKFFVTADLYFNRLENFITDLFPGVNPDYPAYQVPEGIDPALHPIVLGAVQQALGENFPMFSTLPDGSSALVLSFTNTGKADEWGLELGVNYYVTDNFLLSGNWTYFDFDVEDELVGNVLLPNTPKNKFNVGLSYEAGRGADVGLHLKYVEGFEWEAGVFRGKIPQYTLVNLSGGYRFKPNVRLGLSITNLLDNEHYEIFGGSVNGRRALGSVTVEF